MNQKRTIRDIRVKKTTTPPRVTSSEYVASSQKTFQKKKRKPEFVPTKRLAPQYRAPGSGSWVLWLLALGAVVTVVIIIANLFYHATVRVMPTQFTTGSLETLLTAYTDARNDQLRFSTMTITDTLSETVDAVTTKTVERKASGTITIFNEGSTAQHLIEETRFETPDGLIFMLGKGDGITIPSATGSTPGQVQVTVYAQEAGDVYNIEPTEFVIPGWREIKSPKFETQYARSEHAMTGGFVGTESSLDPVDQEQYEKLLQDQLMERLMTSARAELPDGFVAFASGIETTFETSFEKVNETQIALTETGTMTVVLFDEYELSAFIAQQADIDTSHDTVVIDWNNFDIQFQSTSSLLEKDTLEFLVTTKNSEQKNNLESLVDGEVLQKDLIDVTKKQFNTAIQLHPEIIHATLSLKPFWKRRLPHSVDDIRIKIKSDKVSDLTF